jgi:diguanylate cyclase (GGDEF)-like protein
MKVTWLSDGFGRRGHVDAGAFLGRTLQSVCGDVREMSFDWTAVEARWRERQPFEVDVPLGRAGQETRVVQLRGAPFRDATGQVAGYRGLGRDLVRERETLREITYLAMRDPLTHALDRRSLEVEIGHALTGVVCNAEEHVYCCFDLDQFKAIDARAGPQVGDRILREVATSVARNVRVSDSLGRIGGDAFGVLLKHCALPRAIEIANNIVATVGRMLVPELPATMPITVSAGLVRLQPEQDIEHVLRDAERACVQAQKAGGGTVRCA